MTQAGTLRHGIRAERLGRDWDPVRGSRTPVRSERANSTSTAISGNAARLAQICTILQRAVPIVDDEPRDEDEASPVSR